MEPVACPNPSVLAYVRSGEVVDAAAERSPAVWGADPRGHGAVGRDGAAGRGARPAAAPSVVPVSTDEEHLAGQRTQAVLCVHNLSRFAQPAELALPRWAGYTPVEVLGRVPFPVLSDEPYTITLAPYGYLWFELLEEPPEEGIS